MKAGQWAAVGILCVAVCAAAGCGPIIVAGGTVPGEMKEATVDKSDGWLAVWKVAVIPVEGVISDSETFGLLGGTENSVTTFREQLQKAEDDFLVKAVIVRVNSPGGGVTASDIMYHELLAFRERSKKPVVVCITDLGASGGYYLAMAGDHVIAHPTAVTGSIGTIMEVFNIEGLLGKIGVKTEALKSADKKDIGSPFRPMTEEERKILQEIIDSLYTRFVKIVADRRRLEMAAVRQLADGRVFTSDQALQNRLIDEIGYLSDAAKKAKDLAGIKRARLVTYHRPYGYKGSVYALGGPAQVNLLNVDLGRLAGDRRPMFLYLWAPMK